MQCMQWILKQVNKKALEAEFRITFSYSRDGGSNFTDVIVYGPKDGAGGIIDDIGAKGENGSTNGRKFDRSGFLYEGDSSGHLRGNSSNSFVQVFSFDTEQYQPFNAYNVKIERLDAVNFLKMEINIITHLTYNQSNKL